MRCLSLSMLKIFTMRGCTWADYKGEPCGSRPPQLASSAWTAASAKHTSLIVEAAPPERIRKSHCSYAAPPATQPEEEATADLLQVEDGSRDPLDAVEDLLGVRRPLESQSSVSVQVQLPSDSGILRLARGQMKNTRRIKPLKYFLS